MLLQTPPKRKLIISLTPLIDVVFILLVFFMLASNFAQPTEYDISTADVALAKQNDQLKVIVVDVDSAGAIRINGQATSLEVLRAAAMTEIVRNTQSGLHTIVNVRMAPQAILQDALYAYDIIKTTPAAVKLTPRAGPVILKQSNHEYQTLLITRDDQSVIKP